jgi:GntR family transcriptional regulator, carbon starvation induced regulator
MALRASGFQAATLAETTFVRLRADILGARLQPNEKMLVERLCTEYGVGATPLREALSKLSSLDLVVAEGQRGFRVAPVSIENLLDITKTRAWIESAALRAAIAAGDRHWEAQIVAAAYRLKRCPKSDGSKLSDAWYSENREFHDALVGACRSRQTMAFRSQLYDLSDRYRRLSVRGGLSGRDFDAEHLRIMDAALARDANAAVAATIEHFIETTRVIVTGELKNDAKATATIDGLRQEIRAGTMLS